MTKNVTKNLATDLFMIKDLSVEDKDKIVTLIIDFFAAMFAGYNLNESFNKKIEHIVLASSGVEQSYAFGLNKKVPSGKAAF